MNNLFHFSVVLLITGSLVSCGADRGAKQKRENNIETVKTSLELLEKEKIEAFVGLFAENGKQINPYASGLFPEEVSGKKALLDYWKPVPGRFDGMEFPIERIHPMDDPNMILVEFRGKIKLKGDAGYYNNDYYSIYKFDDAGKIVEYIEIFNPLVVVKTFNMKDRI